MLAEDVVRLVGLAPELFGNQGEPKRPGFKTKLNKSYAIFSKDLEDDSDMEEEFSALIFLLGGVENIIRLQSIISPEFTEFNFYLPSRASDIIQDGYLSRDNIKKLNDLNASIGFGFF
ncbi:hypothetical protein ACTACJ_09225 [Pseudomonas syringae]|uniref:hypothetical protein n=1 Tax=Pseudomonas syringae TaxID=317 RepID=UPI003F867A81